MGCWLGFLGGDCGAKAQTTITQENNQTYINNFDMKVTNEQINSQISNTVLSSAQSCGASNNNFQNINFGTIKLGNNSKFDITQSQVAKLSFNCVNSQDVRNTVGSEIISHMTTAIINSSSSEALAALDAKAKAVAKSEFASTSGSNSNTNVNTINNYNSVTETHLELQNVVKNIVENNFTSEDVANCISQLSNTQNISVGTFEAGNEDISVFSQEQASSVFSECIQNSKIGNEITNKVLTTFGIKSENESKSTSKQESTSETSSSATAQGAGQAISNAAQGIGTGIANVAQGLGSAISSMFDSPGLVIFSVCSCCVICIILLVVGYVVSQNPQLLEMAAA